MELKHAMKKTELSLGNRQVNISNDLTTAAHGLSLGEKRVVMSCVAQLDSLRLESGRYKIKVTALDFAETFKIDPRTAYEQLKGVAARLYERSIKRVIDTPRGKKITKHRWVSSVTYHEGEGWIELGFSHESTPYLVALRGRHTSYKLEQASALRSVYAWRLLEMFMRFKSTGLLRISTEDFYHAMDVPETYKRNFKDLRSRCIDVAVKELQEKDHWIIEWKGVKQGGRKITGLEFRFKRNPQQSLFGPKVIT
jgi:plasmid replication initiation protein